jgi:hypothetical protein
LCVVPVELRNITASPALIVIVDGLHAVAPTASTTFPSGGGGEVVALYPHAIASRGSNSSNVLERTLPPCRGMPL